MVAETIDVKIEASGLNWMSIAMQLAVGMHGYYSELPSGSTVAAITPGSPGAIEAPGWIAEGKYHMGITTPSWYIKLAQKGKGPFHDSLDLKTVAIFSHDDRLALAVRRETGVTSLRDIKDKSLPLKVSIPGPKHPARWVVEIVLREHGITLEDIESWGGKILKDRPRFQNSPKSIPIDPSFDAIFDEAIITRRWKRVSENYDLRFLPIDENVLSSLESMGMQRGVIEKGRLRGVDQDVPTIDFSGWVLFCREDMPYELGYLTARALDERHEEISDMFVGEFPPMTSPIDMHEVGKNPPVPLHEGAEAYYKEKGYL